MTFNHFFHELSMHYCNHETLTYANYCFMSDFINENKIHENKSYQADIPPTMDRLDLSPQKIKSIIDIYKNAFNVSHYEGVRGIFLYNSKALNGRGITLYYELIKKYLDFRGKQEVYQFHNDYDWFRILYVLRNIYAHGDGVFKRGVEFPDRGKKIGAKINPYPETITWGNISITRGQKTAPAINEVQVSRLLSHIMIFFTSNDDFNIGILGNQNLSKPI